MNKSTDRAKDLFLDALEIPVTDDRRAFLEGACGGDAVLLGEVENLLAHHGRIGSFLTSRSGETSWSAGAKAAAAYDAESLIGPYHLLEQIGEGGFGLVYVAEQALPVQRRVALKVIKPGMDSREVVARFEVERQALALMDHPNIATVFDAGATPAGRPYFVMELVRGVPITQFCDDHRLTPRDRLGLFLDLCAAVQHAHQKGVIHRDIKPSNVLVSLIDGKPVVKVIDFGVAKAIVPASTDKTAHTRFAQMLGTPLYMSPEQAGSSGLDVDTRTDIYSLGVLLYELLTGTTPFGEDRLKAAGYDEMRKIIREEDPPKPSTRLSDSGAALESISAVRHTEPAKLAKLVRGELDLIVMKSLEKDRERRYASANSLADDIRRYLNNEPVQACAPSARYRLRKFVRRNRGAVLAASLLVLSLLGGIIGTGLALMEARAQRQQVRERETQARQSEAEAKAVLSFFEKRVLQAARPKGYGQGLGREATIRDAVNQAEPGIAQAFADQPLAEASIRRVLGLTYWHMGDYTQAIVQHERALDLRRAHLGADNLETLNSMTNLGQAYQSAGRLNDALKLLEETLLVRKSLIGPDDPETLWTMNRLAETLQSLGRHAEALPLFEEELTRAKATLGPNDKDTMIYMDKLAGGYFHVDRMAEAVRLYEETLKLEKINLPSDHPDRLATTNNLAKVYSELGRWDEAIPMQVEVLRISKIAQGADHPESIIMLSNLGVAYRDVGRTAEALPLLEEAVQLQTARRGRDHQLTALMVNNLAMLHRDSGRLEKALELFREALATTTARLPAGHPNQLLIMNNLAACLLKMGKHAEAEALLRDCLQLRVKQSPGEWWVWQTRSQLGQAEAGLKRFAEAEALLLESYPELLARKDAIPARYRRCLGETAQALADLYEAWGKKEQAIPWREKVETHRKETAVRSPEPDKTP